MRGIQQDLQQELGNLKLKSFNKVYRIHRYSRVKFWATWVFPALIGLLFLPWTQNIKARGNVTTLRQEQRPQELNSTIAGKIVKWYVKEGDYLKAGDTIAQLTEVKENYLDPQLINRTQEQLNAKQAAVEAYQNKKIANENQLVTLEKAKQLKLAYITNKIAQAKLKISADSMDWLSAQNDAKIAQAQYTRQKRLYDSGLTSLVALEQRNQYLQSTLAKKTSAEMKYRNTQTDLINTNLELNQAQQEYAEKIFKTQSDRASIQSDIATAQGEIAKLKNQLSNYVLRSGLYFLIAPQACQLVKAKKEGNEIIKEGDMLAEIVPTERQYAIEIFVKPVDVPLLALGQKVRLLFDGYPAIVFSGWPSASYGTFGGKIAAIETSVGYGGKFRVLIAEDASLRKWPASLQLGTGASSIALLKNVPIYYEIWRNINGFPPEYYNTQEKGKMEEPKLKIKVK
ncbi:MAG: HlyD family efflux transporter periplasmic adaptor subunit [Chitinophagia bacterium]|nr:HlyD family efflux transporter periplasmic adaptor subunit [Chitinophagia bacterium]